MPSKATIKNVSSDSVKRRPAAKASSLSTRRRLTSALNKEDILKFDIVAVNEAPVVCTNRKKGLRLGSDFNGISCESSACKALNLKIYLSSSVRSYRHPARSSNRVINRSSFKRMLQPVIPG